MVTRESSPQSETYYMRHYTREDWAEERILFSHFCLVFGDLAQRECLHLLALPPGLNPIRNPAQCLFNRQHRAPAQHDSRLAGIQFQITCFVRILRYIVNPLGIAAPHASERIGDAAHSPGVFFSGAKIPRAGKPNAILKQMLGQGRSEEHTSELQSR